MNDRHVAHESNPNLGLGVPEHEKFNLNYVLSKKPEYVIVTGGGLSKLESFKLAKKRKANDSVSKTLVVWLFLEEKIFRAF